VQRAGIGQSGAGSSSVSGLVMVEVNQHQPDASTRAEVVGTR